ncbi:hypothetical protein LCM17_22100 [Cereibacter sphaeroides]|nr:hypothetical protein [Cereibacter sphaeroides]
MISSRFFRGSIRLAIAASFFGSVAVADVCDYRLSQLVGSASAGAAMGMGGTAAAAGTAFQAAGFYIIVHSTSGAAMIGSTMAGASAAGTVGIIAGTGGLLGTVAAVISAPITIIAAGAAAVGAGGIEAACFFQDERITEYADVIAVMRALDQSMDASVFELIEPAWNRENALIRVQMEPDEQMREFQVSRLYIVNGRLLHRDWGPNTFVGDIGAFTVAAGENAEAP